MTDNLKYIVTEVNKLLGTDYNLISFDLPPESLLQLLVDVLHKFDASAKFDVKELETEETNRRLIESLKRIQYQPKAAEVDPGGFHKALLLGQTKVVHPIFLWIFQNRERVEKTAYLAKYLLPLNLPNEAMAMPDIANLYQQYKLAMDEFKEAHKQQASSAVVGSHTRELKSDIGAIEAEIENVKKRIERTQTKLDKVPQQELLLETARALRIEKDRQKELHNQIQEQQQSVSRANLLNDRLKKELASARNSAQGTTPAHLLENVVEETQVLDFMVQQKLPQELKARQTEVEILQEVLEEPNLSRNYLTELQGRIDAVNREVQRSIDKKMAEHGNDALGPFRQQANIVARNKETAAEQLDQLTKELREVESTLAQKQEQLKQSVGEVVLRGDDLKQFVNTLRAKSNVYKQQRAELTSIKAEINDLTQTLENLKSNDPSLSAALPQAASMDSMNADSEMSLDGMDDAVPSAQGVTELKRLVEGLGRAVAAARERLTPLSQEVRPLRERVTDLKDERDIKKQAYDALNATLDSEAAAIKTEINAIKTSIQKLENDWKEHKQAIERAEMLLEKADSELQHGISTIGGRPRMTLKETLATQIMEQEKLLKQLQEQQTYLQTTKKERAKQMELFADVSRLFDIKAKCYYQEQDNGKLTLTGNAETFTLQ